MQLLDTALQLGLEATDERAQLVARRLDLLVKRGGEAIDTVLIGPSCATAGCMCRWPTDEKSKALEAARRGFAVPLADDDDEAGPGAADWNASASAGSSGPTRAPLPPLVSLTPSLL